MSESIHVKTQHCWKSHVAAQLLICPDNSEVFILGHSSLLQCCRKTTVRAYPGSEFVVANTLAKWKKSKPNEIDFSQGFSLQVVSSCCSVFNSLPASGDFCHLLITFANSLDPDQAQQNVGPDLDPNCLTP